MSPLCRCACLIVLLATVARGAEPPVPPTPPGGVLPVAADGRPLNLDFETGTLQDWTAEGDAFIGQPIKGDTVSSRRSDMKSQHQGQYWIGGYERRGDQPQGTLTSVPFKVTHPWASFLVGGGAWPETCVELVRKDTGETFSRTSGIEEENLRRVAIDLRPHVGKEIFIRLVDRRTGHWGHLNFDDFRFHATKPDVPARRVQQPLPPADVYKYAGLPPEKAAAVMAVPEGFEVKLFAGEPDVRQPIALCLDDRGRLWVAEAYVYPRRRNYNNPLLPADQAKTGDRILIFEDTDGDGKFDKRTVFLEGLNLVSGLEVGFGGVWIGAAPYLLFVPMKDGEDKPAGPPQILLDGWAWQDTHETLNTFTWGPDGWLYGCHGVFTHSRVGKPGTPDKDRIPINAGIWRYHPTKHVFEVFAHGTSNPWGIDFNDYGQMFIEACVIPHCFHVIQGGRYNRQAGQHFNPYTYADIATIADHLHYLGATPHGGNNRSDSAGGGHAHCGTMIYLGGAWPAEYRGQMFMSNIHGRRINMDILHPKGSGYVASHGKDFLLANDAWARFINFRCGPDGNVYLIDWYDQQACHRPEPEVWDRSNGRIYKISYRSTKPVAGIDLAKKTDHELLELHLNANDWYVRHARRLLQERALAGTLDPGVPDALEEMAFQHPAETVRLRGLWSLHVVRGLTPERVLKCLAHTDTHARAWTIQLALEGGSPGPAVVKKLAEMARTDPSPVVRLYLASAAQRLPLEQRWDVLAGLVAHGEDVKDHNLPLMYWYAAEPLAGSDAARALDLAQRSKVPTLLPFMARRIAAGGKPEAVALLVNALGGTEADGVRRAMLDGLQEGLKGRRQVAAPAAWADVYPRLADSKDVEVRKQALALGLKFGDPAALLRMRSLLSTPGDGSQRLYALTALLEVHDEALPQLLQRLLAEPPLRAAALRGLAAYDDPKTPEAVLRAYPTFNAAEKRDAINTLAARAAYARALLGAVAAKTVAAADVPADLVRQLRNLKDKELDQQIADVWGVVRATPADKAREMARYRKILTASYQVRDASLGRALFAKTCQQCHVLFGVGGKVGPEITGANRGNLDYLLENVLDPSAVIPKEYAVTILTLKDGRIITGIVREQTPAALTVVTATETLTVPRGDVDSLTPSNTSMMPDDQLKPMSDHEVRSLFAYLQSPTQVPLLATADTVKDFFNGKDLTGWDGNPQLWRVENGEIVGRSPGIKRNEFFKSHMVADDFRLTVKVKLVPNKENSGIQFRSEALPNGDVRGYQADVGAGWWGKLYEEHGREVLSAKSGEPFVKMDDWNEYEIVAVGSRIKTFLNGHACVDLDDPPGARRGIFAFQIHSGGPMEVRFKDLKLEVPAAGKAGATAQPGKR
jgi:putative membrane-bound dehydrogenase-like protein